MAKFSFSYSRWSLWEKCPQAFKFKHLDKLPEPTSDALVKGRRVHDDIAKYVEGERQEMPKELRLFTKMGRALHDLDPQFKLVEKQMAFDRDKRPVSWFGANAYFRFIWDVGVRTSIRHLDAVDWKTGKPYGSYDDQKQMFALPAFWMNPQLETFTGHWVYLDHGEVHTCTFNREQVFGPGGAHMADAGMNGMWAANAAMMESDRAFRPTPSKDACRFCNFHADKGGPCQVGHR